MSWVNRDDLERVHIQFRCLPGQHPQAYEVRCRVCATRLVGLFKGDAFELLREQAASLAELETRERDNVADAVDRILDRNQDKRRD